MTKPDCVCGHTYKQHERGADCKISGCSCAEYGYTAPRRCSATYPLGDDLVMRCARKRGHKGKHSLSFGSWPRKKKEEEKNV